MIGRSGPSAGDPTIIDQLPTEAMAPILGGSHPALLLQRC